MKHFAVFAVFAATVAFVTVVLAQGPQPCYNSADPDHGLGNYCQCSDGSCWEITAATDCNPTSNVQINPCPVGGSRL